VYAATDAEKVTYRQKTLILIMAGTTVKSSQTGTVEIKKCGFNTRPKLMVPDPAGDEAEAVDVLPDLFSGFEGKMVRVTIEAVNEERERKKTKGG
jgi:hypothetical protein